MSAVPPPSAVTPARGPVPRRDARDPGRGAPVRRTAQLLVGLVLYAASIALVVRAGLGAMPWDVLTQGVVRQSGWSFGAVTVATSLVVVACWVPLRQRPGVGTLANIVVIGVLVDPFLALVGQLPETLPVVARAALLVAGVAGNGLATALYVGASLGPGPRDGLMTGLVARTGWPVRLVRGGIEVAVVTVGWLLGGTVGVGTLVYALAIGPLVHVLLPRLTVPER
ncbi:YitT family protein [Cellulomonas sp. SLBN-39]|uniref:membrane protein YczE n=1 Tax=Cellulomonas sp. SLBN-39 TaxID=2768446 RepID=UPI00116AF6EF|nr:putative membrane protein YczE [Cellulomonas sp. SLBN-39]